MSLDPHEVGLVRQYLLGQLSPEDRTPIEERVLADGDFFEEILIGEEELIDDYVAHQLSDSEIQAFESHFLVTDERRKQLRFARRLAKFVSEGAEDVEQAGNEVSIEPPSAPTIVPTQKRKSFSFSPSLSPSLSYSMAAVILLAVVGVVIWNTTKPSGGPGSLLAVTLTPGLTREGGETKRIKLLDETDSVEIRVIIPTADYKVYRTRLITDRRSELWASDDLMPVEESGTSTTPATAGTQAVVSTIPARVLAPGDYRMILSGRANNGAFEDVATYPFRVIR